jgi:hypothetical protein
MSLRFKLPSDLVTHLDSYAGQEGIPRPFLIAALIADFLQDDIADPSKYIVKALRPTGASVPHSGKKKRNARLAYISKEDEQQLRDWAGRMAMNVSILIEAIIRDRFADKTHLGEIVAKVKADGYQAQLKIPEIDTIEKDRIGVVALLSPELRAAIERLEKVWLRNTTQQIEQMIIEAVQKQTHFDGPLPTPPTEGSERKLVRIPRQVHAQLLEWSKRENRTIQNQIIHVLHKAAMTEPLNSGKAN